MTTLDVRAPSSTADLPALAQTVMQYTWTVQKNVYVRCVCVCVYVVEVCSPQQISCKERDTLLAASSCLLFIFLRGEGLQKNP